MAAIGLIGLLAACGKAPPAADEPIRPPPGLSAMDYPPRGWTWAATPGAAGARRYGVGSPSTAMRAQVVIVPARAPAEAWFATANRFIARGYGVWLLDPLPRPADAAAVRALVDQVVRPGENRRLVLIGEAEGAAAALSAGGKADAVILWSPKLSTKPDRMVDWAQKLRLGDMRDPRIRAWREGEPEGDRIAAAWMQANPVLRPRVPTFDEEAGSRQAALDAQAPARLKALEGVVRVSGGDAESRGLCARIRGCATIAAGPDATIAALDALTAGDAPTAPPPVRKARGT